MVKVVEDNQKPGVQKPEVVKRRFKDAGKAAAEIYSSFNAWCSILSKCSIEATFAIIAANWAVHGDMNMLLTNNAAKYSLIIAIAFLGLNLFGTGLMTFLHGRRCTYVDKDKDRWEREFQAAASKQSPWPYTSCIEFLGFSLRFLKVLAPVIAAILFVKSLL